MSIKKLVLIRHGQSLWNKENRFTGWTDIDLSINGHIEAKQAGKILKLQKYKFSYAYTSVLKRAIHTTWIILDKLEQSWIPIEKTWYLNERHYGSLQGMNKIQAKKKYGEKQVKQWRRSYSEIPPVVSKEDTRFPGYDIRYSHINKKNLPIGESLELTSHRVIYFWKKKIFPKIQNKKKVIIVAHGNSIRALIKYLHNMDEQEIVNINIPTGIPLVCEFKENEELNKSYYLKYDNYKNKINYINL